MTWKQFLGIEPEESSIEKEFNEACKMSYTSRMIGFVSMFVLGCIITLLSVVTLPQIVTHPEKFAIVYTFGNVVTWLSSMFLFGPCSLIKKMFQKTRIVATLLYFAAIILTLVLAFRVKLLIPVLLSILFQLIMQVWYNLSYIPYARTCVTNSLRC